MKVFFTYWQIILVILNDLACQKERSYIMNIRWMCHMPQCDMPHAEGRIKVWKKYGHHSEKSLS